MTRSLALCLCLAGFVGLAACGNPQETASAPEAEIEAPVAAASVWPHEDSDLAPDPAVRYGQLENGLRYAILANETPSETVVLRLRFAVGSIHESDDQQGLAHFLEHMAFNGSENLPEGEMTDLLERYGLAFGPDTNASTGFDETIYMLDVPAVDEETLDTAFFVMRETADKLLLDPDAIDRERGVILSEERVRNTFGYRAYKAQEAFVFPDALTTRRLPIGLVEIIETAERPAFLDLYQRYYRPERALFVAVGDIEPDAMEARIAETFGDWAAVGPDGGDPDRGAITTRALEAGFFHDPDIPTQVALFWRAPFVERRDEAASRAKALREQIAIGAINRRLARLARSEDAPFVNAWVSVARKRDVAEMATLGFIAEPEQWARALAAAEQELRRAFAHGFFEAEIAEQVANAREAVERSASRADTRRNAGLANRLVGAFGGERVFTHPRDDLEPALATLAAITPETALEALRARWPDGEPLIFMTSNRTIEDVEDAMVAAYRASLATPVEPPAAQDELVFAYTDFGPAGAVADRSRVDDLDITQVRFANNVRLSIKPTDIEDDVARVRVRIGGGALEFPAELPGLDTFVDAVFVRGGLEAHGRDELTSLTAGTTVGPSFGVGGDAFTMNANVKPDDLLFQMQMFAAFLRHPGFSPEAQAWWARVIPTWYETLDATPQAAAGKDVPRILRSGDPRFGVPSQDELEARSLAEAQAVLARAFADGAIEIGVVGDVDVEAVIAAAAATFGAFPERLAEPLAFEEARVVAFPGDRRETVTLRHAGEDDRALAMTYWQATDDRDLALARRMTLARAVLDLKLTDEVREALAATYSPSAGLLMSRVSPGFGHFSASVDAEPGRVQEVFDAIDRVAAAMAAGEISADELDRARQPILENLEERLESNVYWLSLVDDAQTAPDYLERHRSAAADYAAITLEEVIEAAAAYLRPERALRIQVLPQEPA